MLKITSTILKLLKKIFLWLFLPLYNWLLNDVKKANKSEVAEAIVNVILILSFLVVGLNSVKGMETYAVDEKGNELFYPKLLSTISEYQEPWKVLRPVELTYHHSKLESDIVNYEWELYPKKDMLFTFRGEHGAIGDIYGKSREVGFDGQRGYGICQLYYTYHKDFIDSEDFKDWRKQVERCVNIYKEAERKGTLATTFQYYPHRYNQSEYFIFN